MTKPIVKKKYVIVDFIGCETYEFATLAEVEAHIQSHDDQDSCDLNRELRVYEFVRKMPFTAEPQQNIKVTWK